MSGPKSFDAALDATAPGITQLGRYRLCFELASGGMAAVYLARVEGADGFAKLVALKRIHPHLAKEQAFIDMFRDEARIASRISHPHVCGVFDYGLEDGAPYLAMEYLAGEPLNRVVGAAASRPDLHSDPRWPAIVASILADACDGLHAAHELRDEDGTPLAVVHRDISPHNIFVTYDGAVKVLDFGIAHAVGKLHQTRTGDIKGKCAYMSPEQVTSGATVDRKTDVWALGVILWESLCVKRLFRRDSEPESMFAVLNAPIAPPSTVWPHAPKELDAIVMKALERDPSKRYQTARELGRDLMRYAATRDEPVGMSDIAEWVVKSLPEGPGRARQLMDLARQSKAPVPKAKGAQTIEDSSDLRPSQTPPLAVEQSEARLRKRSRVLPIALLAVAGVAALAAGMWFAGVHLGEPQEEVAANDPRPSARATEVVPPEPPRAEPAPPPEPVVVAPPPEPVAEAPVEQSESPRRERRPSKRPEPAREPAAEPGGVGTLRLGTPNGEFTLVRHNGVALHDAPYRYQLPSGRQRLEVSVGGRGWRPITVNIVAGETTSFNIPPE